MSVREAWAGRTAPRAQSNAACRRRYIATPLVTFVLGSVVRKSNYSLSMIRKKPVTGLDPVMDAGFPIRSCFTGNPLAIAGKPLEVGQHGRDELLPARVLSPNRRSKQIEEVARLLGGIVPIARRRREQLGFQFILPQPQRL